MDNDVERNGDGNKTCGDHLLVGDAENTNQIANNIPSGKESSSIPDGGTRAWVVMIGSFFCNGILFGVINSYGIIFKEILANLVENGVTEASSKAALVGSLTIGTTFFVSPVAGILTDRIGLRRTTLIGGALAGTGMLLSSFLTSKVEALCITYGVMYGLGAALAYTPSLAVLGHYFHKYLGMVNGIVTAGSSVFTVAMPFMIEAIIKTSGLRPALWALAALASCIMLCALLFKPNVVKTDEKSKRKSSFINKSIWKNKRYILWVFIIPIALFGYFIPYVHMNKFVEDTFPESDGKLPVVCIAITSGLGRLIFGYIADWPRVNRIMLQQMSFLVIGLITIFLPFCGSFAWLLVISLGMGLFDGCFIALLGPITFDICGQDGATQAIGFLLGLCSIPLTFGPPVAGLIYDHTKSYQLPFLLAGIPPIVGSVAMLLIRCVKNAPAPNSSMVLETVRQPIIQNKDKEMVYSNGQAKLASSESLEKEES